MFGRDFEVVLLVAAIRRLLAQVERNTCRPQQRPGYPKPECDIGFEDPNATVAVDPDLVLRQELLVLVDLLRKHVDEVLDLLDRAVGEVGRDSARTDERVVHPK